MGALRAYLVATVNVGKIMKQLLLDRLAAWILGDDVWGQLQSLVHIFDDSDKSGSEKREAVLESFGKLGFKLAGFLLNLGLEMAVTKLRMSK